MALICFIYDEDFRNLVEEHKLGVEENLTEKIDFLLDDSPYNSQKHQSEANEAYDVFGLNGMNFIANFLGDITIPGAYSHVSCTIL